MKVSQTDRYNRIAQLERQLAVAQAAGETWKTRALRYQGELSTAKQVIENLRHAHDRALGNGGLRSFRVDYAKLRELAEQEGDVIHSMRGAVDGTTRIAISHNRTGAPAPAPNCPTNVKEIQFT